MPSGESASGRTWPVSKVTNDEASAVAPPARNPNATRRVPSIGLRAIMRKAAERAIPRRRERSQTKARGTLARGMRAGYVRSHDRPLLLAHAERLEDQHFARGVRPPVHGEAGEHRPGRAVLAGVPEALSEQPHAGDRRPRSAGRRRSAGDLRERRDSPIPRREGG